MKLECKVIPGFQIASGKAINSPYPEGTIKLQQPFFLQQGLDLRAYYLGTINAQFSCREIRLDNSDFHFKSIKWLANFPSEDFKFYKCFILNKMEKIPALVYQPASETKINHFQAKNVLEIITVKIAGLSYGDPLILEIERSKVTLLN